MLTHQHTNENTFPMNWWRKILCVITLMFSSPLLAAVESEIVSVIGKGDRRDNAQAEWVAAVPKHTVKPGGFIRTHDMSQMAILLPDRTQLRLHQNSQMQIKTLADSADWNQSTVKLNSGRAWSQARPASTTSPSAAGPAKINMETPSATLSIRGTDWEVEVGPDGRTQLVVLSGTVDIANELGALKVGAGEAAVAEIGKAPVRLILANPAERVQWVTAWQVEPRRWIRSADQSLSMIIGQIESGNFALARDQLKQLRPSLDRDLMLADLAAMNGETSLAIELLQPYVGRGEGAGRASALLARVLLARGEATAADTLLSTARETHPQDIEIWLASAELFRFNGEMQKLREALAHAIEIDANNAEAWFLRGSMETERENVRAARAALDQALTTKNNYVRAQAEKATLETFVGNYPSAAQHYEQTLASAPDNYIALTGRGINKLKQGDPEGGLEDFLRAGVIEPRYSRAWFYSAAAFYQLGDARRAREALQKAIQLDPKDPLPHVLMGLIAADQLDLAAATDAARGAQDRISNLKSINQVLNNQKGSANVGSALASFGMEDWARHYATMAYSPWWAGSHLFLADRSQSGFVKNSELFKGFITDPVVFGASQRNSSLLPTPGHHGRADLFVEQSNWRQDALIGTVNGMVVSPVPTAYFLSGDLSTGHSRLAGDQADATNLTLGIGARPNHALGLFFFGTETRTQGDLKNPTLPDDPLDIKESRYDVGINYKHDARNQFWFKTGAGRQATRIDGLLVSDSFGTIPLDQYHYRVRQSDIQFRHAFSPQENVWLTWGYEDSRQKKPAEMDLQLPSGALLQISETTSLHSEDAYLVFRGPLTSFVQGELGVFRQQAYSTKEADRRLDGVSIEPPTDTSRNMSDTFWRSGLQWRFAPQSTVTAVAQNWRRPASSGSIAPIDTLGIAVNDQLTSNGGLYRRERLQVDHEASGSLFLHGFIDHETVHNLYSPLTAVVPDLGLSQLENLRNRRDAFTAQPELEETPKFLEGRVRSFGFAVNHRLTHNQTVSARYRRADAEQTGIRAGLDIPHLPKDYLRLASHWSLPDRWLVGVNATWRSERFRDEANTLAQRIDAGWIVGLSAYWESADKRWVTQAVLDNLRHNRNSSNDQSSKLILRVSYLF